jgi:hypothetical protein
METFESLLKKGLLYMFCLLNAIDFAQTLTFVKWGIEKNPYAVYYPYIWFPLKLLFTFGLPLGIYQLDVYLEKRKNNGLQVFLRYLLGLTYLMILFADIFFLFVVLRNMAILGRLF